MVTVFSRGPGSLRLLQYSEDIQGPSDLEAGLGSRDQNQGILRNELST